MGVPTVLTDFSATAANNSPTDGETIGSSLDDYLRGIQAVTRHLANASSNVASAATADIGAATTNYVVITGTVTITSLGTVAAGIWRYVRFSGALTLTHNATSLILPGGVDITTVAGDCALMVSEGSGNWRCLFYAGQQGNFSTLKVAGASTLTGAVTAASSVKSTSPTAGIGYATGAGGTVTQATSKSTAVTLDKICGEIVTHNASLAANTAVSFNVNNSAIAANDVPVIVHRSGGTAGAYSIYATGGAGVMPVVITNLTAGALAEALTLNFVIHKAVVA